MSISRGFTLIEILIAVTISAFIFTGLITFVGSGLASVSRSEKSMANDLKWAGIDRLLRSITTENSQLVVWTGSLPTGYLTGILLATRTQTYPYVFIGAESFTGYCATNPSLTLTRLVAVGGYAPRSGENLTSGVYTLDPLKQSVYSGTTQIIWTGDVGNLLNSDPLKSELSHPSSLAQIGDILYIADTGNSRVLSYNTLTNTLTEFLWISDGISHPVSLKNESGNLLIGADNGLFRIRESTDAWDKATIAMTHTGDLTFDSIALDFSGITTLTSPTNPTDFTLGGVIQNSASDVVTTWSSLVYTFTGAAQTLTSGSLLKIQIGSIAPAPTTAGGYVLHLTLKNAWVSVFADTFPYFVKGDSDMQTRAWLVIEQISKKPRVSNVVSSTDFQSEAIDIASFLNSNGLERFTSGEPIDRVSIITNKTLATIAYRGFSIYDCSPDQNHRIISHIKKIRVRDSD